MAQVFGIEKLKSAVSNLGGFAKGNRYNVTFTGLPTGLDTGVNENLQYLCESVSLPTKGNISFFPLLTSKVITLITLCFQK